MTLTPSITTQLPTASSKASAWRYDNDCAKATATICAISESFVATHKALAAERLCKEDAKKTPLRSP
ncbi:hypothetical protein ONV78_05895 [Hahella sp. CR1]|uniref:hypothetical protein n=1 Tax=Hahella sp. CR1 TaxID=2992807 RepID=UPI0024427DA8|nr:hypothetical protein [Hahella sp. CR1]MDG9667264.1 hypothetical protein [Hahella sp. CR1]